MKPVPNLFFGVFSGLLLFAAGCASTDVNPAAARAGRGYVDFYTQPRTESWWKVDVFQTATQTYKPFAAEFNGPAGGIYRVEAPPGRYKIRVSFVNRFVESPAGLEVEVQDGKVTPVEVTLANAGTGQRRVVEDRAGGSLRNKVTDQPDTIWRISATARPPVSYTPKAATSYWP